MFPAYLKHRTKSELIEIDWKIPVCLHDRRVEIPIEEDAANRGCTSFVGGIREFVLNNVS
jgi:hypothetical protein